MKFHRWNVVPHVGIGPALLGATQHEVRTALGTVSASRTADATRQLMERMASRFDPDDSLGRAIADLPATDTLYFVDNAVQVTFDASGRANFVGVSHHASLDVRYQDIPVFEVDAVELAHFIACDASPDIEDSEYPINWTYPALELGLYRGCERSDIPLAQQSTDASGLFWEQISVGAANYFSHGKMPPPPVRVVKVPPTRRVHPSR